MIDIPGNGIMMALPVKSVGGKKALATLSGSEEMGQGNPPMEFPYELVMVIANGGFTDEVMDTAREAGAAGGTVVHAKGTGAAYAKKFLGLSLAEEKEVILILATAATKSQIMKAVAEKNGSGKPAGAVCMSLPVSEVAGLRNFSE